MCLDGILAKTIGRGELDKNELKRLLTLDNEGDIRKLLAKAYEVKAASVGRKVYFRGLIEFSNICEKNCFYCGIRKDNHSTGRYVMPEEAVLAAARFAFERGYGSVVIQSGERTDGEFTALIEGIVRKVKELSGGKLGITLSLGEQTEETYSRWFEAGAHRYLLRIETSNPGLYRKLHPANHSFEARKECLSFLRSTGYQVGTGVMVRMPFQSYDDLVDDLVFFRDMDADMIGMGPYIVSRDTPCGELTEEDFPIREDAYGLAMKMIAVARLFLKDVNIASTTALQALKPFGREAGLMAGANIIMPNITDARFRRSYRLYDDKPGLDEDPEECVKLLEAGVLSSGEEIGYGEWGDSPHFGKKR